MDRNSPNYPSCYMCLKAHCNNLLEKPHISFLVRHYALSEHNATGQGIFVPTMTGVGANGLHHLRMA